MRVAEEIRRLDFVKRTYRCTVFSSTKLSLLSCTSHPVPMIVLWRMGMMRVSLNLDDVANRIAKPWSFVVIMTVMIVSRSPWRVPPEKSINQIQRQFSPFLFFFFFYRSMISHTNYFITSPLRSQATRGEEKFPHRRYTENKEESRFEVLLSLDKYIINNVTYLRLGERDGCLTGCTGGWSLLPGCVRLSRLPARESLTTTSWSSI